MNPQDLADERPATHRGHRTPALVKRGCLYRTGAAFLSTRRIGSRERVAQTELELTSRVIAVAVVVVTAVSSLAALVLLALSAAVPLPEVHGVRGWLTGFAFICSGLGLAITRRQPRNAVGWIFLVSGVCAAGYELAEAYTAYAIVVRGGAIPAGEWAAWFGSWLWVPTTALIPTFLFLVFPDGRLPSPRWRPVVWYGGFALGVFTATVALLPGPLMGAPSVRNPLSPLSGEIAIERVILPLFTMLFLPVLLAVAALIRRFRRSTGVERLQLKWIAYASVLYAVGVFLDSNFNHPLFQIVDFIAICAIPAAAGVAVLRYRLYEIEILINRTLVYGATSATIAATFFVGIVVVQALLRPFTSGSDLAIAASTLLSFALFQPVRRRVQDGVDRRFDRSRYDAARTLDAFADRLRDEVDLDALRDDLLGAVRQTMAPAHTSLWLRERSR
jgi:hypothetical protein